VCGPVASITNYYTLCQQNGATIEGAHLQTRSSGIQQSLT
jgi:hypothetical protein